MFSIHKLFAIIPDTKYSLKTLSLDLKVTRKIDFSHESAQNNMWIFGELATIKSARDDTIKLEKNKVNKQALIFPQVGLSEVGLPDIYQTV